MTDKLEDLFRPHHHSFAHNVVPENTLEIMQIIMASVGNEPLK